MKFLAFRPFFIIVITLLLSSCSPHQGTGVWKATGENEWGISRLVVGFEGKAEFTSVKRNNAVWHCFWTAISISNDNSLNLKCTASTNTEQEEVFFVTVNDQGFAELRHESKLLSTFSLVDENPSPRK